METIEVKNLKKKIAFIEGEIDTLEQFNEPSVSEAALEELKWLKSALATTEERLEQYQQ